MDHPIKFHEQLQLTKVGIPQAAINFTNVTMESERFIVCREKAEEVIIVDLAEAATPKRLPLDADSVIMHMRKQIIAVRSGRILQMFDLDKISKIKEHIHHEDVVFWKWIDEDVIGIVTETAIYHWNLNGNLAPLKIFDRHQSMVGCQIINYRSDSDRRWLILIGLTVKGNRVAGSMQLYSTERGISQPIEGHAACFLSLTIEGNAHPSNLLVFTLKNEQGGKLVIIELGSPAPGNMQYQKKGVDVPFSEELVGDIPISIQGSSKHGVVYLITKQGFVYIFDVETGTLIYSNRISIESIFITTEYSQGGFIAINRKGQVLSVSLNEEKVIEAVGQTTPELARKLTRRWNVSHSRYGSVPSSSTVGRVEGGLQQLSIALPPPSPLLYSSPSNLISIKRDSSIIDSPSTKRYESIDEYSTLSSLPPPSSILLNTARREDSPSPLYSTRREDTYASPGNYDRVTIDSYLSSISPPNRRNQPSTVETNNNNKVVDSNERAEKAEKERDEIEAQYKQLLTLRAASNERAERAEKERDEMKEQLRGLQFSQRSGTPAEPTEKNPDELTAQYKELTNRHADLSERLDKVMKERNYFEERYLNLEKKCRDAMNILSMDDNEQVVETKAHEKMETKVYSSINWASENGETASESSRRGILPDYGSLDITNYSSLFDD